MTVRGPRVIAASSRVDDSVAVRALGPVISTAEGPFDPAAFPYRFLAAFRNKDTTIKRLRAGSTNASDLRGGVLQRNNVHIAVAAPGSVPQTLAALRGSPTTAGPTRFSERSE